MSNEVVLKEKYRQFLRWPLYLSALIIVSAAVVFAVNVTAGWIVLTVAVVYTVTVIVLYIYYRSVLSQRLAEYGMSFSQTQRQMMNCLDVPYALLDTKGRIMWANAAMEELSGEKNLLRKTAHSLFPEIEKDLSGAVNENSEMHIGHEDKNLKVVLKPFRMENPVADITDDNAKETENEDADFIHMYVFDETEIQFLKRQNSEEKLIVGMIYIDNYDEALQNVDDVRRTMIFALVERKINQYINSMDGIVRKMENDKYFIVVKSKYVTRMQSDKFSLLDDVKTVNIDNDSPITVSIGIGMGADSYQKICENARAAMDMALGRGGDQAVIKDGGKIYCYGGKTKTVEKNTRVRARVKAQALREIMMTRDSIMVMGHHVGDMDSFGASIGLYRIAKALERKLNIVINEMNSTARQMFDRFGPDQGYEPDLFISSDEALERINKNTLLIIVDVNRISYTECPELCKKTQSIVVLDHHRQSADVIENALLSYIEPYASSTCEMVSEILQYIGDDIKLRQQEADAMYGGITIDTNNFTNRTGVRTFEAAAFLRRNGADVSRVRKMFRDDMSDYKAKAAAIERAETYMDHFAMTVCPSEGISMPTVVGSQVANELLNIKGIKASFVCTAYEGQVYISARSIDEVNVQLIMERLGGGGHLNLAGAQLKGCTCAEATELLKEMIKGMIEDGDL